jgi:hypothetical protein
MIIPKPFFIKPPNSEDPTATRLEREPTSCEGERGKGKNDGSTPKYKEGPRLPSKQKNKKDNSKSFFSIHLFLHNSLQLFISFYTLFPRPSSHRSLVTGGAQTLHARYLI